MIQSFCARVILVFTLFTGMLPSAPAANDKLIPLTELSVETLDDMLYVMKRCAGLTILIHTKMTTGGDGGGSPYFAFYERFSEVAFNIVVILAKQRGTTVTSNEIDWIFRDIQSFTKLYNDAMNDSYIASGSHISPFIQTETEMCVFIKQNVLDKRF